jgi:hypothetical protein
MFAMFFKCFRRMFQVFHLSFFYVASVASECFKSTSSVAKRCTWEAGGGVNSPRAGARRGWRGLSRGRGRHRRG